MHNERQTIRHKQEHQHRPIHGHDQHHRGDVQNGVKTVIQKVKYVLFESEHSVVILFGGRSQAVELENLSVGGQGDREVGNYCREDGSADEGKLVVHGPAVW